MIRWLAVVLLAVMAAGCIGCVGLAFEPWESGSPAWHYVYVQRGNGSWADEPGYAIPHRRVVEGR